MDHLLELRLRARRCDVHVTIQVTRQNLNDAAVCGHTKRRLRRSRAICTPGMPTLLLQGNEADTMLGMNLTGSTARYYGIRV
jgi:hypothetical protein